MIREFRYEVGPNLRCDRPARNFLATYGHIWPYTEIAGICRMASGDQLSGLVSGLVLETGSSQVAPT